MAVCTAPTFATCGIAAGLLVATMSARAASLSVVADFTATFGGGSLSTQGSLTKLGGELYGLSSRGSEGAGQIYVVGPDGRHRAVYDFKGGFNGSDATDGAHPMGTLLAVDGVLYGVTQEGGGSGCAGRGCGTIFSLTPSGTYSVVYRFAEGRHGVYPSAGLTVLGGRLYGTTFGSGTGGNGTVFSVTTAGAHAAVIYSFLGGSDGGGPRGLSSDGTTLYGTTTYGGSSSSCGTVFSLTPQGVKTTLHTFANIEQGCQPYSPPVKLGNALYGTTLSGGDESACTGGGGCGTVFRVTLGGEYKMLQAFSGPNGLYPNPDLINVGGILYGTTDGTQDSGGTQGNGATAFAITRQGALSVLYHFDGGKGEDGCPCSGLTEFAGKLYGVVLPLSGQTTYGYVYALTP